MIELKLVLRTDFSSDIESLNLLNYLAGMTLKENGWIQNVASDDETRFYTSIEEVINLQLQGANHNGLATYDAALKKLLRKAQWYAEASERYGVWLRTNMGDETYSRQALITSGRTEKSNVMSLAAGEHSTLTEYPLLLQRMPLWESTSDSLKSCSSVSVVGGASSISGIRGTDPARIARFYTSGTDQMWFGFKSSRHITLANFVSPWELESGSAGTDTTGASDGTASPGAGTSKMTCSFGTNEAMDTRVTLMGSQISPAHHTDLRGDYEIVLRAKAGAGITAGVRLGIGLPIPIDNPSYKFNPQVSVSGTTWALYSLGKITFPAGGKIPPLYDGSDDVTHNTRLVVQAKLSSGTAGANALDMDCLIPIPIDEGHGYFKFPAGSYSQYYASIYTAPNGLMAGTLRGSGVGQDGTLDINVSPVTFSLPVGDSKLVIAANGAYGNTVDAAINYIERWRTLRGGNA